jgi:hypothetical protein
LRQRGRLRRIGGQGRDDVHPIERVQVIEVNDVVLNALRGDDQIAQQASVRRRLGSDGGLDCPNRSDRMHGGAHAANALREGPRVTRVASLQDQLDTAKHRRGRPRVLDLPPVDLGLDPQMPFDAGDGIDDDVGHGSSSSLGGVFGFGLG